MQHMRSRSWRLSSLRVALAAAALVLIALTLSRQSHSATQGDQATSAIRPRTSTPIAAPPDSTLARIHAAGVLRCGADASGGAPFWFGDPNDPTHLVGFEVDIMQSIAINAMTHGCFFTARRRPEPPPHPRR